MRRAAAAPAAALRCTAMTTMRALAATVAGMPVRFAIHMKKAMPSPVPNSAAAPSRWTTWSASPMSVRSILMMSNG